MSPPHSWLTWVSVTDNITKKKVTKSKVYVLDFYNTIMNRIFKIKLPNDVLDDFDYDKIYVTEDGRSAVDDKFSSCISAIKCLKDDKYVQFAYNKKQNIHRTILYNNKTKETSVVPTDGTLVSYVSVEDSPWSWYFND